MTTAAQTLTLEEFLALPTLNGVELELTVEQIFDWLTLG
jgi:hypothetical protein